MWHKLVASRSIVLTDSETVLEHPKLTSCGTLKVSEHASAKLFPSDSLQGHFLNPHLKGLMKKNISGSNTPFAKRTSIPKSRNITLKSITSFLGGVIVRGARIMSAF